jgi:hypothetical protein
MKREYPSTPIEAFEVAIEGAYFGKYMDKVLAKGQVKSVPWEPLILVDTWWDLGTAKQRKDACSVVFTQDVGLEVRVIDFYGNTGEGLAHYAKMLSERPYVYGQHNGPHDLMVKEIGSGKTRMEIADALGIKFQLVPNVSFSDGIEAVRAILPKCWFDEANTDNLRKALRVYRKEFDDRLGKFKDTPLKDWSCVAGETMVRTLKGWKQIKDVSVCDYVWGYSIKEHRLIPTKIDKVGKTKINAQLIEILLDNGNKIK